MLRASLIAVLLFSSACSSPLPPPSEAEQLLAVDALESLQQIQTSTLSKAFESISDRSHTRHIRVMRQTSQHHQASSQVVRYRANHVPVILGERFDGEFGQTLQLPPNPIDFPAEIDFDSFSFTSPRFRDEFSYRIVSDTLVWGRPAQAIDVSARTDSDQEVQYARYVIDLASSTVTSFELEFNTLDMLHKEYSRYLLRLRPGSDSTWVPYQVYVDVSIGLPLGRSRRMMQRITFYNYDYGG